MSFTQYDRPDDLPADPLDWTPEQRRAVVEWFATLPLTELRERQAIKSEEQGRGYIMVERNQVPARVLDSLNEQWEQLADAVSLQTFGVTMFGSHDAQQPAKKS